MKKSKVQLTNKGLIIFCFIGFAPVLIGTSLANHYEQWDKDILVISFMTSGVILGLMVGLLFKLENPKFGSTLYKIINPDNNQTTVSTK